MIPLVIKKLGLCTYSEVFAAMQSFTKTQDPHRTDELWLTEHPAVFTLGQQGERGHILNAHDIPVVQSDRGGHVTYHGPGQLVAYPLLNLKKLNLGVRQFVTLMENIIIDSLKTLNINANSRKDAPGVYVENKKIASIGLRVRRGCCYHGIALNVNMDLTPFSYINPCGMAGLQMVCVNDYVPDAELLLVQKIFVDKFCQHLGFSLSTQV